MSKIIGAYNVGKLKVDDIHKIHYELYGNPKGTSVVYLHGGPGSGFTDKSKRFFNPKRCNVLFFDQRGCGNSTPFGSLKNNTTQALSNDISKLMKHVGFDKAILFGGSWGSTLALYFAINNPKLVSGLVLRGIFLANKFDIEYFSNGKIVNIFFPDVWSRIDKLLPKGYKKNPMKYFFDKITKGNKDEKILYFNEWTRYESSVSSLIYNSEAVAKDVKSNQKHAFSLAILEGHYIAKNNCFLEDDYIIKNAKKIKDIPISITHGRYDFVCPPINAFRLHQALPNSKLNIVLSGHSGSDKEMNKMLISEMKDMERRALYAELRRSI